MTLDDLDEVSRKQVEALPDPPPLLSFVQVDLLVEPGTGADVQARFALHVLAVRVTQPGHEQRRAEFAQAVATQLGGGRPKAVQAYLLEQLQLTGTRAVAEPLGKVLLDPDLCDQAARALAAIRDGAAEQPKNGRRHTPCAASAHGVCGLLFSAARLGWPLYAQRELAAVAGAGRDSRRVVAIQQAA